MISLCPSGHVAVLCWASCGVAGVRQKSSCLQVTMAGKPQAAEVVDGRGEGGLGPAWEGGGGMTDGFLTLKGGEGPARLLEGNS